MINVGKQKAVHVSQKGRDMFLFGEERDVIDCDRVDAGGMFDWTVGVVKIPSGYRSFVETGWGGGGMGPVKNDEKTAKDDIERLMSKV